MFAFVISLSLVWIAGMRRPFSLIGYRPVGVDFEEILWFLDSRKDSVRGIMMDRVDVIKRLFVCSFVPSWNTDQGVLLSGESRTLLKFKAKRK